MSPTATAEAWSSSVLEDEPLDVVLRTPELHAQYHRILRALIPERRSNFIDVLEALPDEESVKDELRCWYLSMLFGTRPDRDELLQRADEDNEMLSLDDVRKILLKP